MGRHKKERTEHLREATIHGLANDFAVNEIEQNNFQKLLDRFVVLRIRNESEIRKVLV